MGRHHLPRTGHTGLGGTGSPTQGVVGVSFRAPAGASCSKNRAQRPGGDGESRSGGGRSILQGPCGGIIFQEPGTPAWGGRGVEPRGWSEYRSGPLRGHHLPRTGHNGQGGTGSPAQGVVGVSFRAHAEASSSKNRAHRPRGDGESNPGGGWSILQSPCGGIVFQEPGTTARGGRGVPLRGWSEYPSGPMRRHHLPRTGHTGLGGTGSPTQVVVGVSFRASAGASCSQNRAQRPGGDGESRSGGGRSILQGPCGGIIFQEPGTPASGGAGSPAQGVVKVSLRAHAEASSSKNRAYRPGGDGESSPGGGRSVVQGPWGGIIFQERGTPA